MGGTAQHEVMQIIRMRNLCSLYEGKIEDHTKTAFKTKFT